MLLFQSRLGPKKPNLTIAWAGPYQIEWVYTNGSVKLKDLAGFLLPGVKIYEVPLTSNPSASELHMINGVCIKRNL